MKKLLLSMLGVLVALPAMALDFTYHYKGKTLTYTVLDENAKTVKTKDGTFPNAGNTVSGDLEIPSVVTYNGEEYSVTAIDGYAFRSCTGLTSVVIPNSVTSIGSSAFTGCSGLTKAEFSSIEHICSINFESSDANPLYYAHHLYINGEEITDLVIPESVTSIGYSAFTGCTGLTSVVIPNSVTSIGSSAFTGCSGLTSVVIPNSVTSIGYSAFTGCSGLTSVVIPNSVTSIGSSAFTGCSGLTSVVIPNSVTSIGYSAFLGCSELETVYFNAENCLTCGSTWSSAFPSTLKNVVIGEKVSSIPDYAFSGCSGLETVYFNAENCSKCGSKSYSAFPSTLKNIVIGEKVSSIPNYAFYQCSGLTSVVIPNSVISIGNSAFNACSGLTSITISNSVSTIGESTFYDCCGLTSVIIPNSVTSIGNYAFSGCSGLTSVEIPNSVTSIGNYAFSGCSGLETVYFNAENCSKCGSKSYSAFPSTLKNIVIGEKVSSIPNYAFSRCGGLETVYFNAENCSTFVSSYPAFTSKLKNVVIGEKVTSIPDYAFYQCSGLTSVVIPNSVTSIGNSAFYQCSGLTSVVIPNSISTIGEDAFRDCSGLTSIIIPNAVTSIGSFSFYGCYGFMRGAYPSSLKNPFSNDKNMHTLAYSPDKCISENGYLYNSDKTELLIAPYISGTCKIPDNVTTIGEKAFYGCADMTSLELPASIKSIGNESFSGCSGLNAIYSSASPAPQFDISSFSGLYDSAVINIPENILGDYTHRYTNWTLFKNLQTDHDGTNEIFESEGFAYEHVSDSDVRIVKSAAYESLTDLTVPATLTAAETDTINYEQLNVVAIAPGAFSGLEALERVVVSEGISSVGSMAFKGCPALTAVTLPSTVADINASTFEGCSALASLTVGADIAKVGSAAFAATKLTSVDLTDATDIDDYAFADIPTLKTLNTGDNLTSIGIGAFKGANLTEVTLSSTDALEIGKNAFSTNAALTTVTLGDGVASVGDNAFKDCGKLKTVSVGKDVASIGAHAFDGTVVATLNLVKDGALRKIGNSAFSGIRARGTLDLPDALEEIGDSAFINPRMYTEIILPANRKLRIGNEAFAHAQRVTEIIFPDTITSLGDGAFRDNATSDLNIKSDNIGAEAFLMNNKLQTLSVAGSGTMGARAFAELPELVSANIDFAEIGEQAFTACPKLETVVMGDVVKIVGKEAFLNSPLLSSVTFGLGLEELRDNALKSTKVNSISFPSAPEPDPVITVGTLDNILLYLALGNRTKELNTHLNISRDPECKIDLGSTVEKIMQLDVYNPSMSLTLPASLRAIEISTTHVDSLYIPTSSNLLVCTFDPTTMILGGTPLFAQYMFIDRQIAIKENSSKYISCTDLVVGETADANIAFNKSNFPDVSRNIHIGAAANSIVNLNCGSGNLTFSEGIQTINTLNTKGSATQTLRLPASLETLGTVSGTTNELIFTDGNKPLAISSIDQSKLTSVYLGRNISSAFTFGESPVLESLIVGDSVTTINDRMFKNCSALKTAVMSDSVSTVGEEAFYGCSGLDVLSISANVKTIGNNAYAECNNFQRIVARGLVPAEGNAGFGQAVEDNVPLYVPDEVVDDYMDSDLFYPFWTIESFNDNVAEAVITEGEIDESFAVGSRFKISDLLKIIVKICGRDLPGHHSPVRRAAAQANEDLTGNLRWFAPTPEIASVDQEGNVTVNGEGDAEIWVYVLDGSDKKAVIGINKTQLGDVNRDSLIDISDVNVVKEHIQNPSASSISIKLADMNGDGIIDITDVNLLKEMIHNNNNK